MPTIIVIVIIIIIIIAFGVFLVSSGTSSYPHDCPDVCNDWLHNLSLAFASGFLVVYTRWTRCKISFIMSYTLKGAEMCLIQSEQRTTPSTKLCRGLVWILTAVCFAPGFSTTFWDPLGESRVPLCCGGAPSLERVAVRGWMLFSRRCSGPSQSLASNQRHNHQLPSRAVRACVFSLELPHGKY